MKRPCRNSTPHGLPSLSRLSSINTGTRAYILAVSSAIGKARRIEIARQFRQEQAAETGKAKPLLAAREREEHDLQALPSIDMAVPGSAADCLRAQRGERIALGVEPTRGRRRGGRMELLAFLGDGEEDQAIDQPQQLAEEVAERQFTLDDALPKLWVLVQEPIAEREQRRLDAVTKSIARGDPFLARGLAPPLQSAIGRWPAGRAKPARMDEQPERGKIREAISLENLPEVGLDVGGAGEARVGPHKPQTLAIAAEAPEGFVARIQPVLQRERRGAAAAFDGEFRHSVVEIVHWLRDDDRRAAREPPRGDG